MRKPRTYESRARGPNRSLVFIDVKGRLRAMIRECARRETWGHVEMLQDFQESLLTLQDLPRGDALQVIDGLLEKAHTIKFAFESLARDAATVAAFMEAEELPEALEKVRAAWEGGHRNRSAARWRWAVAVPADRLHPASLDCRMDELGIEPAGEGVEQ